MTSPSNQTQPNCVCPHDHQPLVSDEHDHHHDHDHGHHHHHRVSPHRPKQRQALLLCVVLTAVTMVIEFTAGIITDSLMLISDAIHMLSHASSLGVSVLAVIWASRETGKRLSFGFYRIEILAALANAVGLAGFSGWIIYEAILRLQDPRAVMGPEMTAVAVLGLIVNLTTAWILSRAGLEDLNTKSAFFHMLADTFSSIAIVIGGVVITFTQWYIIDPLLSLLVAAIVGRWAWTLLRDSTLILMEQSPQDIDPTEVKEKVTEKFAPVIDLHDLHIWEITSQYTCLTAHLVIEDMKVSETASLLVKIKEYLKEEYEIVHPVFQLETPRNQPHDDHHYHHSEEIGTGEETTSSEEKQET